MQEEPGGKKEKAFGTDAREKMKKRGRRVSEKEERKEKKAASKRKYFALVQRKKKEESVWVKKRPSRPHSQNEKWVERRKASLAKPKRKRARETKQEQEERARRNCRAKKRQNRRKKDKQSLATRASSGPGRRPGSSRGSWSPWSRCSR